MNKITQSPQIHHDRMMIRMDLVVVAPRKRALNDAKPATLSSVEGPGEEFMVNRFRLCQGEVILYFSDRVENFLYIGMIINYKCLLSFLLARLPGKSWLSLANLEGRSESV
jgi:hypothetical protein